ncbi:extensin family protein [Hoeflea sp. G2-23]|uniref:Extensin family protein n=1 Tax=Hoeflea algicola TaxID=2983763 RepID=A0ABT3Z8U5_9HYPH|nr:extensin family protein [Hoeflea algicola]MCY0148083.1 extensin family protein [Hoeflea algicola]
MHRTFMILAVFLMLTGMDLPQDPPVPVPKPEQSTETPESKVRSPAMREQASPDQSPGPLPDISAPADSETGLASCEAELRKLGVTYERLEPLSGENGCGINTPYAVTKIASSVVLRPATQLRCETALALAQWVGTVVIPATSALPGDVSLNAINHGSAYVCRRRNNRATGKLSEHSIGNAIDIVNYEFAGRKPLGISPRSGDGNFEEAFQRAVRAGGCLHFTTVLGPGANASHDNHLHLDIAKRNHGYRLCQ